MSINNRKTTVIGLIFLFLVFAGFGIANLNINKSKTIAFANEMPSDFNFILSYGVDSKNEIDTAKSKYTKDMITEKPISTEIKFTTEEMKDIYTEMKNINILDYPNDFYIKSNSHITPYSTYKLKIIIDNLEKDIYWKDDSNSETKEAVQLRNLLNKIHGIISEKEEYKKLPVPKGGYM